MYANPDYQDPNNPSTPGTTPPPPPPPPQADPTPPTTTTPPSTTAAPGSITDPAAFGQAWLASGGKTPADLAAFIKAHPEFGATIGGSKGDKVTIGGKTFDAVLSAGTGGTGASWNDVGSGTGADGAAAGIDPSYLAPFTTPFDLNTLAPTVGGTPGQAQLPAPPSFASAPQFQTPGDFRAPTAQDILNDPSFTFRRDQALQGMSAGKAAQGLFNSGGTVYDLGNLASNFASQEYGNIYNRDLGQWDQNWQHGLSAYNAALQGWNANNQNLQTGFTDAQGLSNELYSRANQQYGNQRDIWYANQTNPFTKLTTIAQLGAGTAANAG